MILLTLIKKEVKQFFRQRINIIMMIIFPVILIFIMGKSLNGLMTIDENIFNNKVIYYRVNAPIENEVDLQRFYDFMIHFEKNTNVKFIENNNYKEVIDDVNNNKAICFMDFYDNDINYFRSEKTESTESTVFRNLYEQYMKKYTFLQSIYKSNPEKIKEVLDYEIKILLKDEGIEKKQVNAFTYYTFAQLILIILYISNLTSISMYKGEYLHTKTRFKGLKINKINILLSKIALGIAIGILQIIIVYIVSTKFFNVSWGGNLLYIFMVLFSLIIFSSALGIFMSTIFSNKETCYMVNNILIIIMGFLGGSYVPICLVKSERVTSFLSEITPSYWANISILSLSYDIKTKYYIFSIFISFGLSLLMLILGSLISKLKAGDSFD
ncbi:MAG: ABC transporter permease [Terrisporobacter othiniensis]|uniref:ABC transporter permease n=1 Tax=Terrisporobacter petrolearius TaxID=1460447 RepID=UPI0022E04D0C|nr:ABC transporter permease [Terrisporobacter petrolearius]MDU4861758.1 ABC transporter permease [Terrisporobacter othiniensis]MDU6995018.1 ABC transporter permease [Terrisporobacter othiniensis]